MGGIREEDSRGKRVRFLDADVFIYACYKPRRQLTQKEGQMKELAKRIISDVSQGRERVVTTVVHLSEVVSILKHGMPAEDLARLITGLLTMDNVEVHGVSGEDYLAAAELGKELRLDPNDALAVDVMRARGITEIYSFGRDFEKIEGITRLPRI
ncbi:MAG: type II toxin-antitoxin system VapC family toxin [Thermofilum sp.]